MALSETQAKELDAFVHFFGSFELDRPVISVEDLTDGAALYDVLTLACVTCIYSSSLLVSILLLQRQCLLQNVAEDTRSTI